MGRRVGGVSLVWPLMFLEWVLMSWITVGSLLGGLHGSGFSGSGFSGSAGVLPALAGGGGRGWPGAAFAAPEVLFVALFVLLWSGLFRSLHARGGDELDAAATLFAIARNCLGMAFFAAVWLGLESGWERGGYAALLLLAGPAVYEVLRVLALGAWKTALGAREPEVVVIVGSGRQAGSAWRRMRTRYFSSIRLLGFVDDQPRAVLTPDIALRYLGGVESLAELLPRHKVSRIVVAVAEPHTSAAASQAIEIAEDAGVQVTSLDDFLTAYA